jgi:hypothetical protein
MEKSVAFNEKICPYRDKPLNDMECSDNVVFFF